MSEYGGPPDPEQYGQNAGQPGPYGSNPAGQPPAGQPGPGYPGPGYGQAPMPQPPMGASPYGSAMMAPQGTHVDPATGVVIPNGTEIASAGRRIGAFFLGALLAIVTLGIGYAIWGLIEWSNGRTPVQRVLGLRCYKNTEMRVFGWGDMFLREFVYWACGIIFLVQIANFIVFLTNGKRQGFHDMASSCIVLHDPNKVMG